MRRDDIRKLVNTLVKKHETKDPFELADILGVNIIKDDLGYEFMGYRSCILRIPSIVLNSNNSKEEDLETCSHELGHHCCGHNTNTQALTRQSQTYTLYGVEYEANCFMVELLLHGANLAEHPTRQAMLNSYMIPEWAERYVDWQHLERNMNLNSFDSYY